MWGASLELVRVMGAMASHVLWLSEVLQAWTALRRITHTFFCVLLIMSSLDADAPAFGLDGCAARARVVDCHDGDTLKVVMPVPWAGGVVRRVTLRLAGVDTPEVVGPSKQAGKSAHSFVLTWLCPAYADGATPKQFFRSNCVEVDVECFGQDKYGRTLARVMRDDGSCLNDVLVERGWPF